MPNQEQLVAAARKSAQARRRRARDKHAPDWRAEGWLVIPPEETHLWQRVDTTTEQDT